MTRGLIKCFINKNKTLLRHLKRDKIKIFLIDILNLNFLSNIVKKLNSGDPH